MKAQRHIHPVRTIQDKEFYAEYDVDSVFWCVFGDNTGFAYASYLSRAMAEYQAQQRTLERRRMEKELGK